MKMQMSAIGEVEKYLAANAAKLHTPAG